MPTIITRGAASARGFGWTTLTRSGNYWFATISGAGYSDGGTIFDSAGDPVYVGGNSTTGVYLAKLNSTTAATTWQNWYAATGMPGTWTSVAPASSGQFFIAGRAASPANSRAVKFTSSGTVSWQRDYGNGSGYYPQFFNSATDSSDNILTIGNLSVDICCCQTAVQYTMCIHKINSSGVYQWGLASSSFPDTNGYAIASDSSGNVYATHSEGGTGYLWVGKFTSAGSATPVFQTAINSSYQPYGLKVASSGNIYVSAFRFSAGTALVKMNSSGTFQWCRYNGSINDTQYIAIDADENIYATAYYAASSAAVIFKYNSSGSLQWVRSIQSSSGGVGPTGIAVNGTTISLMCTNGSVYFTAKIPTDGSLTGAYTVGALTYTYGIPSLTASTATDGNSTSTASFTTFSLSVVTTPTIAVNTATETITVKNL